MKNVSLSSPSRPSAPAGEWAEAWQRSWDQLEERYVSHREELLSASLDVVETMAGAAPVILDLACGTGTVTRRLLERLPAARSIALDVDPVLLRIAAATFGNDDRVQIVRADLNDQAWVEVLPKTRFDAVVTTTALHWLSARTVLRLYKDLGPVLARGGVFVHAERMPLVDQPRFSAALAELAERRRHLHVEGEAPDWSRWWEDVARDPMLESAAAERRKVFSASYPREEFSPPADWHVDALRQAGFAEAGVVWRAGAAAIVAALRP